MPMTAPNQATRRMAELARAIHGEEQRLDTPSVAQVLELLACLDASADVQYPVEIVEHGQAQARSTLALLACRPEIALLIVPRVATATQDLVLALARAAGTPRRVDNKHACQAYKDLVQACARKFPGLDWYVRAPSPPNSFYEFVPAAMLIEERSEGFNAVLEEAQAKAGLPVGRQIEERQDREEAIRDLGSSQPVQFRLGDTPRVEWLRRLMRDDIDPTLECDNGGVQMLAHFLSNVPELALVEEVLARGATIQALDIVLVADRMARNNCEPEDAPILDRLLRANHVPMDAAMAPDAPTTLRQHLQVSAPEALARWEQVQMQGATPHATGTRIGPRL